MLKENEYKKNVNITVVFTLTITLLLSLLFIRKFIIENKPL